MCTGDPPCLNGGICNNGQCECDFGISGPQCENSESYDISMFVISAWCVQTYSPLALCTAPGEACGHFYCLFGGSCNKTSEQCTCMPGYGGPYCTERTCKYF